MPHSSSKVLASNLTDDELFELYLSLSPELRGESFTDTADAAEITGVSVRSIQLWIEGGAVRAITPLKGPSREGYSGIHSMVNLTRTTGLMPGRRVSTELN